MGTEDGVMGPFCQRPCVVTAVSEMVTEEAEREWRRAQHRSGSVEGWCWRGASVVDEIR